MAKKKKPEQTNVVKKSSWSVVSIWWGILFFCLIVPILFVMLNLDINAYKKAVWEHVTKETTEVKTDSDKVKAELEELYGIAAAVGKLEGYVDEYDQSIKSGNLVGGISSIIDKEMINGKLETIQDADAVWQIQNAKTEELNGKYTPYIYADRANALINKDVAEYDYLADANDYIDTYEAAIVSATFEDMVSESFDSNIIDETKRTVVVNKVNVQITEYAYDKVLNASAYYQDLVTVIDTYEAMRDNDAVYKYFKALIEALGAYNQNIDIVKDSLANIGNGIHYDKEAQEIFESVGDYSYDPAKQEVLLASVEADLAAYEKVLERNFLLGIYKNDSGYYRTSDSLLMNKFVSEKFINDDDNDPATPVNASKLAVKLSVAEANEETWIQHAIGKAIDTEIQNFCNTLNAGVEVNLDSVKATLADCATVYENKIKLDTFKSGMAKVVAEYKEPLKNGLLAKIVLQEKAAVVFAESGKLDAGEADTNLWAKLTKEINGISLTAKPDANFVSKVNKIISEYEVSRKAYMEECNGRLAKAAEFENFQALVAQDENKKSAVYDSWKYLTYKPTSGNEVKIEYTGNGAFLGLTKSLLINALGVKKLVTLDRIAVVFLVIAIASFVTSFIVQMIRVICAKKTAWIFHDGAVIYRKGRIFYTEETTRDMEYFPGMSVSVKRTVKSKICKYGEVVISNGAGEAGEIVMIGVKNPNEVRDMISKMLVTCCTRTANMMSPYKMYPQMYRHVLGGYPSYYYGAMQMQNMNNQNPKK